AAMVKKVPANGELHIVNPPRAYAGAYPISTFTYVLLPTKSQNALALRKMVFWALTQGQAPKYTARLWFAPIPKTVLSYSEKTLNQINATRPRANGGFKQRGATSPPFEAQGMRAAVTKRSTMLS